MYMSYSAKNLLCIINNNQGRYADDQRLYYSEDNYNID